MHLSAVLLLSISVLFQPSLSYRIFDSRSTQIRATISQCRSSLSVTNEREQLQCYDMIRCVVSNVPADVTARWSAGANVLAFIPTIVALLSNSINEVATTADESFMLAVALSLSSVTAFVSRLGDMPVRASEIFFQEKDDDRKAEKLKVAWEKLEDRLKNIKGQRRARWWFQAWLEDGLLVLLCLTLGAGIWYEVYQVTRYGVIVNACPIKVNVGLWVGLSQFLTLLNVACRKIAFDTRTLSFKLQHSPVTQATALSGRHLPRAPACQKQGERSVAVVLRSPRDTFARWTLQTFTAVASFTLYAFGTVILASMTFIPASDAIRALAMLTIGAGVGRSIGYWKASPSRMGSQVVVVDVPKGYLHEFADEMERRARRDV